MGTGTAARALLAAALTVLVAGIVAATVAPTTGDAVDVAVAVDSSDSVVVGPALLSPAVPIELVVSTDTTAPSTATTATTGTATTATTIATTATTATPPPTTAAPAPTVTSPPPPSTTTTAPPAPPTTSAPPADDVDLACERDIFERTNATRAANGLAALAFDSRPHAVARSWSRTMAAEDRLDHNPSYGAELDAQGVRWRTIGENVGRGDATRIFDLWMGSATHRRNILDPSFTAFAVACIADGGQTYVTQDFYG